MANHGYVTTRKTIKPEVVTDLLNRLNQERFNGILKIEYTNQEDVDKENPHVWDINCEPIMDHRVCWLASPHKFEMRHGGGSDFIWWIDSVILNELALLVNGSISDDGVGDKWKGKEGYMPTFREWVEHMWRHNKSPALIKAGLIKMALMEVPEEFR